MKTHKTKVRTLDILSILHEVEFIEVVDLAQRMNVSTETIRRDARLLEEQGAIIKSHGKLSLPHHLGEATFERRMRENPDAKMAIARAATDLVNDGDSMIIDTGSTTTFFARELRRKRNLTVVTNSTEIARLLVTVKGNRIFLAGGEMSPDDGAAYGSTTADFVSRFNVKFAFLAISALSAEHGPTDASLGESDFARLAIQTAKLAVVLCDSSKFGKTSMIKVCPLEQIDMVISERAPDQQLQDLFLSKDVKLLVYGN
jgi:DeoR family transcriptional regulator, glycerol-3-phosphate regulon repressor